MCTVSDDISRLFSEMSLVSWLLIAVGFVLVTVEFFQPTKSVAAGCGIMCALGGIAARMMGGGTEGTFFLMLIGFAFLVYGAHAVMLAAFKRDWLTQSAYLNVSHVEIRPLLGLKGVTVEPIDPYGHIVSDDRTLYVTSETPVPADCRVQVTKINGDKIYVALLISQDPPHQRDAGSK